MTEKPPRLEGITDNATWEEIKYHLGKLCILGIVDPQESAAVIDAQNSERALNLLFHGATERKPLKSEIADLKAVIDFLIKVKFLNTKSRPADYE